MTRKTEAAYTSVLDHIKSCVPGIIVSNIVTDYEVGLSNALANVFPGVRLQKCWFHMAQVRFPKKCNNFNSVKQNLDILIYGIVQFND